MKNNKISLIIFCVIISFFSCTKEEFEIDESYSYEMQILKLSDSKVKVPTKKNDENSSSTTGGSATISASMGSLQRATNPLNKTRKNNAPTSKTDITVTISASSGTSTRADNSYNKMSDSRYAKIKSKHSIK